MKTCSCCGSTKPLSDFYVHAGAAIARCKECTKSHARLYRYVNAELVHERDKIRDEKRRESKNAATRAWRDRKRATGELETYQRRASLQTNYGVTIQWYESKLAEQGGRCRLCGRFEEKQRLSVDHDHNCCPGRKSCGKCVRGLLCSDCNLGLGKFSDSATRLRDAADYLEEYAQSSRNN